MPKLRPCATIFWRRAFQLTSWKVQSTTWENLVLASCDSRRPAYLAATTRLLADRLPATARLLTLNSPQRLLPAIPVFPLPVRPNLGIKAGGIGSHAKGWYWPTAFIREFIAITKSTSGYLVVGGLYTLINVLNYAFILPGIV